MDKKEKERKNLNMRVMKGFWLIIFKHHLTPYSSKHEKTKS